MKSLLLALLVVITAARFWTTATAPVTAPEAFAWMQSQRLDWAYFDQPAGTAALVDLGTRWFGPGPLGLRWFAPLFAALASLALFAVARRWFGAPAATGAVLALNVLPAFHQAAWQATSTQPALALSLASLAFLALALDSRRATDWIAAGLAAALAVQFSYLAALLPVAAGLLCLLSARHRRQLHRPAPWLAAALALLGLLPAIVWNQLHRWPMTALGTWRSELTPDWAALPGSLGFAVAQLSAPALLAGLLGLALALREARVHAHPRHALLFAAPFLALAAQGLIQGWTNPAPLLFAATILLPVTAAMFAAAPSLLRGTGALLLFLTGLNLALGPFPPTTPEPPWAQIATELRRTLAQAPAGDRPPFLIAPTPDATAALNYHLAGTGSEVYLRESQDLSNQFGLWPRYDDFVKTDRPADEFFQLEGNAQNPNLGRNALYLGPEEPAELPQTITAAFGRVTLQSTLTPATGGKLRVYLCENYQTMPL